MQASTLICGTSRSSGSVADLLAQADPKLVSVDVWDTLIVRDRPADSAKLATARRMVLNPAVAELAHARDPFWAMAVRVAVEARLAANDPAEEYELTDVLRETLGEMAAMPEAEASALVERLVRMEIEDEIAWSHARPDVEAVAGWGEVVVASDFYMKGGQLQEIVGAVSPNWKDVPLYVSVDRGCSKRLNGGLLRLIRRELGVASPDHVHIGDNAHSDVAVQVSAGGMAIRVQTGEGFPRPGEFGVADVATCSALLQRELGLTEPQDPEADAHEFAGRVAAPLAVFHVARAIEEAYALGLDRVHYVSREGIFSSAVHEVVEPVLRPPGVRPVEAIHLSLSRRATFGASLQPPFRASLQRMWSMYAQQSVRAMFVSIGVDPDDFADDAAAAGLQLDEILVDARRDSRVERLLADREVEARIEAHVHRARDLLRRYVLSRTTIDRTFIMADIGWRGTIQDNLVRALGIRQSVGVYLGLFPYLNAQPPGTRKIGVAFDANRGEDYLFADPPGVLERPWTPDQPSTVGFEEVDGVVVPLHDKESGHVSSGIDAFQRGTLSAARGVAEWMVGFGFTANVLHDQAGRWARTLWESPPEGLADIWFASDHDDSFGALNSTSFGKDAPGPEWLRGSLRDHVKRGAEGSGWPAGYLAWRPVRSLIELGR
jgi:FMN phosphatase YigB (HAD superfamily)